MVKDGLESIKTYIESRLVSPLFGALVVSWLAWNHRAVLAVFSDMGIRESFWYIDSVLYKDNWQRWTHGLIYPALTALGYVLIFWWPSSLVLRFNHWHKRWTEKKLKESDGLVLLTFQEGQALRAEKERAELELQEAARKIFGLEESQKRALEASAQEIGRYRTQLIVAKAQGIDAFPSELEERLTEYLVDGRFVLMPDGSRNNLSFRFGRHGVVTVGACKEVASWKLTAKDLTLMGAMGEIACILRFHPSNGSFHMEDGSKANTGWMRLDRTGP